jgi:CRP-like cAMP-binding protein
MFILRGRVKITHTTAEGRVLLLSVLGPGEPLGEQSAIDKVPVHITATALEPVEVMVVAAPDFVQWVSTRRTASVALLQYWSARLRKADSERVEFVMNDTLGRVAGRLVELTERYGVPSGAHVRIALPLSQEELGSWAGSSREATSRALQSLRRRRLIATRRREIMVLDPRAMRARATADS